MNKERALIIALEIIDTCRTYDEERCIQCPFNMGGCILTDGNNIPTDWKAAEAPDLMRMRLRGKL